jgi:hypothetical protein
MTTTQMTVMGGTKRARDAIATSQKSLRLPVAATDKKSEHERRREERISKSPITTEVMIPKDSSRNRKRTKLSKLRDNRHIHRAVAAMEEQLASFEKTARQPDFDFTSTSFSASSSFFFDIGSSQRDESSETDVSRKSTCKESDASEENELAALASSLRLEEFSSSSGRKGRHRRRGAISIVMSQRR